MLRGQNKYHTNIISFYGISLKENWSPKINLVFIVSFGSLGHIKSSFGNYYNSKRAIHEKIGFEIGIFPLFGLCHCRLATGVSVMLWRRLWGRCSAKSTTSRYKAKAVSFRILFSSTSNTKKERKKKSNIWNWVSNVPIFSSKILFSYMCRDNLTISPFRKFFLMYIYFLFLLK